MSLPNITTLTEPPIVGRFYLVPCIKVKGNWAPIIGPLHADAEAGIEGRHWHYDFRFLGPQHASIFFNVSPKHWEKDLPRLSGYPVWVDRLPDSETVIKAGPQLRAKQCFRSSCPMPATLRTFYGEVKANPLTETLESIWTDTYKDAQIADLSNPVCPHKRVPLAGQPVDENNCVRCPAHGLMFSLTTGKLVRQLPCTETQKNTETNHA